MTDRSLTTSIETYCGHYLDYLSPQAEGIELADIARGLAQTCRFAGQTTRFYSVAEHAVYVADLVLAGGRADLALAALHHDSHEAYLGDWPSPLKHALGSRKFERLADALDDAVAHRFEFEPAMFSNPIVKAADLLALRREAATLKFSHGVGPHWGFDAPEAPLAGIGWEPDEAERRFLKAHNRLTA
jgi:5'-deoxynucleotidase YfbR-like HD superfamily hydrolase